MTFEYFTVVLNSCVLSFTELYQCEEITPPNLKLRNPSLCIIWAKTPEQSERVKETESEAGRVYAGIIFAVSTCAAGITESTFTLQVRNVSDIKHS